MVARSLVAGALASVGVGAILSPALLVVGAIAYILALIDHIFGVPASVFELVFALVPWLIGVVMWSLAGGYVAGAMTERSRARNGAAAALAGLTAMLLLSLGLGLASPTMMGLTLALGAIAAIPVAILFGRVGAIVAPRAVLAPAQEQTIARVPSPLQRPRLLPVAGQKGGERTDDESN